MVLIEWLFGLAGTFAASMGAAVGTAVVALLAADILAQANAAFSNFWSSIGGI